MPHVTRGCFFCSSWRCEGDCSRRSAAQLFARIKQGVERPCFEASGWVYAVLTIDRNGTFSGDAWKDSDTAYRELSRMTTRFLEELRRDQRRAFLEPRLASAREQYRALGARGEELRQLMREEREELREELRSAPAGVVLRNEWAIVVEAHKSGWPHANLMFYAPALAAQLERERSALAAEGTPDVECKRVRGRLAQLVTRAGWGAISSAEQVRSRDALAGYLVKIAGHFDESLAAMQAVSNALRRVEGGDFGRAVSEVAKLTQLPLNAPTRFRRLRSGKGFLPAPYKSDRVTGTMVVRVSTENGPHVVPVQKLRPELQPIAAACCELEERLWVEEMECGTVRSRTEVVQLPSTLFQVPLTGGPAPPGDSRAGPSEPDAHEAQFGEEPKSGVQRTLQFGGVDHASTRQGQAPA